MKTAESVLNLGLYASSCCNEEGLFDIHDRFSRCPKCAALCKWDLVERVFSFRELDGEMDTQAAA